MKAILLLGLLLLSDAQTVPSKTVYICDSGGAKRYHFNYGCKGLSACKNKIKKTTQEKAKKDGRTLCKWEIKAKKITLTVR